MYVENQLFMQSHYQMQECNMMDACFVTHKSLPYIVAHNTDKMLVFFSARYLFMFRNYNNAFVMAHFVRYLRTVQL